MKYLLNGTIVIAALGLMLALINHPPSAMGVTIASFGALALAMRAGIEGRDEFRQFFSDNSGLSALEYIVVAAILTLMVLTALWNIAHSLQGKLEDVNNNL